jgi:glutathione peroxidase
MDAKFYSFTAKDIKGREVSMNDFKGKTVLVVNTASKCGFANQFDGLEALYEKYKDKGLVILGFPCNQFANQEPGDEQSIEKACTLNYGISFPMFQKVDVNGENAHPLYKHLKKELPGLLGGKVKWNFTKFLIDGDGQPIKRFSPQYKPEKLEPYIKELVN